MSTESTLQYAFQWVPMEVAHLPSDPQSGANRAMIFYPLTNAQAALGAEESTKTVSFRDICQSSLGLLCIVEVQAHLVFLLKVARLCNVVYTFRRQLLPRLDPVQDRRL